MTKRVLLIVSGGIDYPFVVNGQGTDWMETVALSTEDRKKILHGNAEKLLKM